MNEKEQFAVIEHAVMMWSYLARKQESIDALNRLVHDDSAKDSWRKLFRKEIILSNESFQSVASSIGRSAVRAHRDPDEKKTAGEIKEAGGRASALAEELLLLIVEHSTLRHRGEDLMHPPERAALSRIT